ncbi:ribokinase-like protein [Delitschia confertaspora ATCC 74209]|uniref:Ribokinase n=1 Tax=Delitschia confertaspora ATCC 74209 TaxID=1513339 RepID=A0A9P4JMQ3_9PLEO|nr:ribokinase-like protein [Delitschia confertaspora ATCC 74209]
MPSSQAVISVVGSLNVDLVTRTARVPVAGETLTSESFDIGFGGKGANQAVACARLSRTESQATSSKESDVQVRMVGAVGDDEFHSDFLKSLEKDGLNTEKVQVLPGQKTGVAVIIVESESGQNRILVSPGANYQVPTEDLVEEDSTVALFQLELPMDVVLHNIKIAREKGVDTILNPAPAVELPNEVYQGLGHLIVNETEACILSGIKDVSNVNDWDKVASVFISRGVKSVIITLGGDGVVYQTNERSAQKQPAKVIPALKVKVVDTTAAGDTFVGAYSVAVARWKHSATGEKFDLDTAIAFANRAASMTVQRKGAQASIPWADEVPES